jgi:putative hemolysin
MAYESPAIALAPRLEPRDHIVDILIAERAPKLAGSPVWPLARPVLYRLLDYRRARRMADAIAPLPGREALELVSNLLSLKVEDLGLDRVPRGGRMVAVCNHPTGIADGVAVWDALSPIRPDTLFYANADALRVAPGLRDILIPVEWVEDKRTREGARATLHRTREAMEAERPLVVFPAGRLARQTGAGLVDPPWAASAFSLARKYEAPIVPICLAGPWSSLFHFFDRFSGELRDITLFQELLNKRGGRFRLLFGHPVAAGELPADAGEAAARMKAYVEQRLPAEFGARR